MRHSSTVVPKAKSELPLDDRARHHWVIAHILPHEGEVRSWLRRNVRTLSTADIDDILQESYTRLCHVDFDQINNGRSYLFTVIRNLLHEQARRARILPLERMSEIDALRIPDEEAGPERKVSARQELERLERLVENFPEQCRRAFQLQKFRNLSVREIAAVMEISEKTVEKHLASALVRILDALKDEPTSSGLRTGAVRHDADESKD